MQQTKKGSNGQGTVTPTKPEAQSATNGKTTETATPVVVKMEETKEPVMPLKNQISVSEIQSKTENLNKLFTKRERIVKVQKSLNDFKLSSDKETAVIALEDGNGNNFQSGNPELIKEAMQVITLRVNNALADVDKEILNFA